MKEKTRNIMEAIGIGMVLGMGLGLFLHKIILAIGMGAIVAMMITARYLHNKQHNKND